MQQILPFAFGSTIIVALCEALSTTALKKIEVFSHHFLMKSFANSQAWRHKMCYDKAVGWN